MKMRLENMKKVIDKDILKMMDNKRGILDYGKFCGNII
jgi:hypothetical protein